MWVMFVCCVIIFFLLFPNLTFFFFLRGQIIDMICLQAAGSECMLSSDISCVTLQFVYAGMSSLV